MKLLSKYLSLATCSFVLALGASAQPDTETLYVQVRDQGIECGRGINRSAEAQACQQACDSPTFNLRVLLGAVPQPVPSEIMTEVAACNSAYAAFKTSVEVTPAPVEADSVEASPPAPAAQTNLQSSYLDLRVEMAGFRDTCDALTRKTRHQVACVKFCTLAVNDTERLDQGDAELARQISGFNGDASRLPNMNQCRRFYGAATR